MRRIYFALAIALFATAGMAADLFTLNIPVQLSHLHPTVTQVKIRCRLSGNSWVSTTTMDFAQAKEVTFPVTGGTFNRIVQIVYATEDFPADQLSHLTNVTGGSCQFQLHTSDDVWYVPYATGAIGPVNSHAPGTAFANVVSFTIPH